MCGGIKYTDANKKEWKVYFPSPRAALPVLKRDGEVEWVTWGKRKEETAPGFMDGGWARLDSIKVGKWQRFDPKPVLLPVQAFMEKDTEKVSHWFDLNAAQFLQGLMTIHDDQARIYVVTTDTPPEFDYIHDRWPRIIEREMKLD